MDLLRKLLRDGAQIAAAVVEKGVEELEKAEQRRRQFEEKAAKKVIEVVDAVEKGRTAFDQRAEKRLNEFATALGELIGDVLGEPKDVDIIIDELKPTKLEKPVFKAPAAVEAPAATEAAKPAKKRAAPKKRPSAGKKLTR